MVLPCFYGYHSCLFTGRTVEERWGCCNVLAQDHNCLSIGILLGIADGVVVFRPHLPLCINVGQGGLQYCNVLACTHELDHRMHEESRQCGDIPACRHELDHRMLLRKADNVCNVWACRHKLTHWKQTVFYLDDIITVEQGETITGTYK
jgi:hypothetical protein